MVLAPTAVSSASFTWNSQTVGGASNLRVTNGPTLVDITSIGNGYFARYPTIKDWTVSFDLVYDIADVGQAQLSGDLYTPTKHTLVVNLGGGKTLTGDGYVESFDYSFDPKEVIRASVTIKGSGLLSYA
jgi:hypothetical protein